MPSTEDNQPAATSPKQWALSLASFGFVLVQSLCTAVMAISGLRVLIGLTALAAAAGLNRPASGFHQDAIRIPMMALAILGSLINLYVLWRIHSLRNKPSAQWRKKPITAKQRRSEIFQIALSIISLLLVFVEWYTHRIVHNV